MRDWVTLYSGNPAAAKSLAAFLSARSIEATEDADRGRLVSKRGMRFRRVRVRVPPDQLEPARLALAEWRIPHKARTRETARRVRTIMSLSVLAPAAWALASFAGLPGVPAPRVEFVFVLWMISVVVVAWIAARRRRSDRVERSR